MEDCEKIKQKWNYNCINHSLYRRGRRVKPRVAIINDGKIILVDETDKLIKIREKSIKIELNNKILNLNNSLKINIIMKKMKIL